MGAYVELLRIRQWIKNVAVLAALRPGAKERDPGASELLLDPQRARLQAWLVPDDGRRGLKLSKVHPLLTRDGIEVPYSSLHRFAVRHCGFADSRRLTVRMAESAPGEVAEIDFGRLGLVFDPVTEKRRVHHALIVTLLHSRHQYVHVCISQKLEDPSPAIDVHVTRYVNRIVAAETIFEVSARSGETKAINSAQKVEDFYYTLFSDMLRQQPGFIASPNLAHFDPRSILLG